MICLACAWAQGPTTVCHVRLMLKELLEKDFWVSKLLLAEENPTRNLKNISFLTEVHLTKYLNELW